MNGEATRSGGPCWCCAEDTANVYNDGYWCDRCVEEDCQHSHLMQQREVAEEAQLGKLYRTRAMSAEERIDELAHRLPRLLEELGPLPGIRLILERSAHATGVPILDAFSEERPNDQLGQRKGTSSTPLTDVELAFLVHLFTRFVDTDLDQHEHWRLPTESPAFVRITRELPGGESMHEDAYRLPPGVRS